MLDHQTIAFDIDRLAHSRHPPELGQHETAHRAHVVPVEAVAQGRLQLGESHAAFDPPLVFADDLDLGHLIGIVLILNLADDLLQLSLEGRPQ